MSFSNIVTTALNGYKPPRPQQKRKPNPYDCGSAQERMNASRHHALPVEAKKQTGNSFMNR